MSKMYIAVLDSFDDFMVPTLVAHAVLGYDASIPHSIDQDYYTLYRDWFIHSFKKCVLRVNQKEFDKIAQLPNVGLFHENNTLQGKKSCAILVVGEDVPNVLKFAKLWKPKETNETNARTGQAEICL